MHYYITIGHNLKHAIFAEILYISASGLYIF